uniref:Nuclear receptor n=1 Tax=Brachionus calyciflorus TaxID=104777 RepID=A0A221CB05_9BILA|nr:nuclear receptor [Brachionus calyciflorus]
MQLELFENERQKLEEAISREFYLSSKKAEKVTNLTKFVFGPCKVCSDEATGILELLHVNHVKRSLLKHETYICLEKNLSCKIHPKKTKKCQLCRWNACLKAGMSINGIRMGRIPNSMKILKKIDQTNQNLEKSISTDFKFLEQSIKSNLLHCFSRQEPQNYLLNTFLSEKILNKSKESQIMVLGMLRDKSSQLFKESICEFDSHEKKGIEMIESGNIIIRYYSEEFIIMVKKKMLRILEKHAWTLYKILCDLPGFQTFSVGDLKRILTSHFFVLLGLRTNRLFMNGDFFMFLDGDILLNRELFSLVMSKEISNFIFDFSYSIKAMNFTCQEFGLLMPFILSSQDSSLSDLNLLKEINEFYSKALVYEFNLNRRSIEFVKNFKKVISNAPLINKMCQSVEFFLDSENFNI